MSFVAAVSGVAPVAGRPKASGEAVASCPVGRTARLSPPPRPPLIRLAAVPPVRASTSHLLCRSDNEFPQVVWVSTHWSIAPCRFYVHNVSAYVSILHMSYDN